MLFQMLPSFMVMCGDQSIMVGGDDFAKSRIAGYPSIQTTSGSYILTLIYIYAVSTLLIIS